MIALAGLVLMVPLLLLRGWVLMLLWEWFIAPLGVDELTLAHAIGLSALLSLFMTIRKPPPDEDDVEGMVWAVCVGVIGPLMALAIGAVAHGAMP